MVRSSTGTVDFVMQYGSWKRAFVNGKMEFRTGGQPSIADAAATGTLVMTATLASGAWTAEVRPAASVTLATGAAGSVNSITIAGYEILGAVVPFDTSLTVTATAVAAQINKYCSRGFAECYAVSSGAKITIYAVQGSGNITGACVATCTTITTTDVALGTEVAGVTPINGLGYGMVVDGVLQKDGVWSGVALVTATVGWWRLKGSIADADALSTTLIRMDGNCGSAGSDLVMATTNLVSGRTYTVDAGGITLPKFAS